MNESLIKWITEQVDGLTEDQIKKAVVAGVGAVKAEQGRFGCHCDLDPDMEPDGCVIDTDPGECIYAKHLLKQGQSKWACQHWRIIEGKES